MGKVFVEYKKKNSKYFYQDIDIRMCLYKYCCQYILENRKIISKIDKKVRDAALADALSYVCTRNPLFFDFFFTESFYIKQDTEGEKITQRFISGIDSQYLLTKVVNEFAYYMFNQKLNMVESVAVATKYHMNDCTGPIDADEGAIVLIDFINYIAERNGYDKKFTIGYLYEISKMQKHNAELNQLKEFLKDTSSWSEELETISINKLFASVVKRNRLDDNNVEYHNITDEAHPEYNKKFANSIYTLAYAYAKLNSGKSSSVPIIDEKIKEMKKDKIYRI